MPQSARQPAGSSARPDADVSVVVPTYAHERYVEETLRSLLADADALREIIVVDDGSRDGTAARLATWTADGRIRYVRQDNSGQSAARNRGAAEASGDYLLFLDDDDLLPPGVLARHRRMLAADPQAGFVYGAALSFASDDGPPTAEPDADGAAATEASTVVPWTAFLGRNRIRSPGQCLVRRRAFEQAGGFATDLGGAEDWDLWLRLGQMATIRHVGGTALHYREHPAQASRDYLRMTEQSLAVIGRHVGRAPAADRVRLRALAYGTVRYLRQAQLRDVARAAVRTGDVGRFARAAITYARVTALDGAARVALKLSLLRHGRWRLTPGDLVR